ncbi:MAG: hypothetical protein AB8E15_05625 [Bdellovibrionales bacterium]
MKIKGLIDMLRSHIYLKNFVVYVSISFLCLTSIGLYSVNIFKNSLLSLQQDELQMSSVKLASEIQKIFSYSKTRSEAIALTQSTSGSALLYIDSVKSSKFSRINVFTDTGSLVDSVKIRQGQAERDNRLLSLDYKLSPTQILKARESVNNITVEDKKDILIIKSFVFFRVKDDTNYILETLLQVEKSFFVSRAKNLNLEFASFYKDNLLFESSEEIYQFAGQVTNERVSFRGEYFLSMESGIEGFKDYTISTFKNFNQYQEKISSSHLRVFLFSILVLLLITPFLYLLSKYMLKPVQDLLQRVKSFHKNENFNLLPVSTIDEVGELTKGVNQFIKNSEQVESDLESKVLQSVVMKQRMESVERELGLLGVDYIAGTMYRKNLETIISESSYSQNITVMLRRLLPKVNRFFGDSSSEEVRRFVRREDIGNSLEQIYQSSDRLSQLSADLNQASLLHLSFMDLKDSEQQIDLTQFLSNVSIGFSTIGKYLKVDLSKINIEKPILANPQKVGAMLYFVFLMIDSVADDPLEISILFDELSDKDFKQYQLIRFVPERYIPLHANRKTSMRDSTFYSKVISSLAAQVDWQYQIANSSDQREEIQLKFYASEKQ